MFGFNLLHRLLGDVHTPHYFNEVALVGTAADKPSGDNAKDNMLYYEQDTGLWKRYRIALSAWVLVAPNMSLMGYDYGSLVSKNLALDPTTKALQIKSELTYEGIIGDHGELTGLGDDDHPQYLMSEQDPLAVKKAGDTMTGFLTLNAAPTSNLHAATKKYVDDQEGAAFNNYKCRAYMGAEQQFGQDSPTKINLSVTTYDPEGCFDSGNKSIDIKKTGDYFISAEVWYDLGIEDGAVCSLQVKKNGTTLMEPGDMCRIGALNKKDIHPAAVDVFPLALNDRLTLWGVFYATGTPTCTLKVAAANNYLTVLRVP